jgi:hypothetical protein
MPADAGFLLHLASLHALVAIYELEHGVDPTPRIALAEATVARALARNHNAVAANHRQRIYRRRTCSQPPM